MKNRLLGLGLFGHKVPVCAADTLDVLSPETFPGVDLIHNTELPQLLESYATSDIPLKELARGLNEPDIQCQTMLLATIQCDDHITLTIEHEPNTVRITCAHCLPSEPDNPTVVSADKSWDDKLWYIEIDMDSDLYLIDKLSSYIAHAVLNWFDIWDAIGDHVELAAFLPHLRGGWVHWPSPELNRYVFATKSND